jgi:hypothetical protein
MSDSFKKDRDNMFFGSVMHQGVVKPREKRKQLGFNWGAKRMAPDETMTIEGEIIKSDSRTTDVK